MKSMFARLSLVVVALIAAVASFPSVRAEAQDVIVGSLIKFTGPTTARTYTLPNADAYLLSGTTASKKVVGGQATTATATDTVVTGLATVTSCMASYDTDPADANFLVSCTIGDQAGSPAAGSVIIKQWQNTSGSDPTPAAGASFSKKVNWIAFGS